MSGVIPKFLGDGLAGATLSEDRTYRYCLWRRWREPKVFDFFDDSTGDSDPTDMVAFIGLNPSTANETEDDPTIRRCVGFAKSWGFSGIAMLNLFAFRATDPKQMRSAKSPIGLLNDEAIGRVASICRFVICCWGTLGEYRNRGKLVRSLLVRRCGPSVYHLGLTKSGQPKHPLYLSARTDRIRW